MSSSKQTEPGAVQLLPIESDTLSTVYRALSEMPERWPRIAEEGCPSPGNFATSLWAGVLDASLVVIGDRLLGVVSCYDYVGQSAIAWAERISFEDAPSVELDNAFWRFLSDACKRWSLRRVFFDIPGHISPPVAPTEGQMKQQGELRDHIRYDDYHWDLRMFVYIPPPQ